MILYLVVLFALYNLSLLIFCKYNFRYLILLQNWEDNAFCFRPQMHRTEGLLVRQFWSFLSLYFDNVIEVLMVCQYILIFRFSNFFSNFLLCFAHEQTADPLLLMLRLILMPLDQKRIQWWYFSELFPRQFPKNWMQIQLRTLCVNHDSSLINHIIKPLLWK